MPHVNAFPHLCAIFLTACQAEIGIDSGLVLALYEHKRLNIFLIYLVGWRHCAEQSEGKGGRKRGNMGQVGQADRQSIGALAVKVNTI